MPAGVIVSGFMPLKNEINPVPLLRKLSDKGAGLALPVVAGRGSGCSLLTNKTLCL